MILITLLSASLAGCIGNDDETESSNCSGDDLKIAFDLKDDLSPESIDNPNRIADYLCDVLDMDVTIYDVDSAALAMEALRFGNADIAMNIDGGPAWVGWNAYDLEVLAADTKDDGRAFYNAHAWVLKGSEMELALNDNDETTDPFALLEGKTSCHTGWLKSAGMLMPMGYMIGNGYVNPIGDTEDINSLRDTINAHFDGSTGAGNPASIPESGGLYSGYSGALECLSEGYGDVAFAKGDEFSTVHKYCDNDDVNDNSDWCLPLDQYVQLPAWGSSPSHPIMYNPDTLDVRTRNAILNSMLSWNDEMWVEDYEINGETYTGCYNTVTHQVADIPANQCGSEIISAVTSKGYRLVAGNSQNHLGSYSDLLGSIPGLSEYYHSSDKYGITDAESTEQN